MRVKRSLSSVVELRRLSGVAVCVWNVFGKSVTGPPRLRTEKRGNAEEVVGRERLDF